MRSAARAIVAPDRARSPGSIRMGAMQRGGQIGGLFEFRSIVRRSHSVNSVSPGMRMTYRCPEFARI